MGTAAESGLSSSTDDDEAPEFANSIFSFFNRARSPSFSPARCLLQPRFRSQSRFRARFPSHNSSRAHIFTSQPTITTHIHPPCWNTYETRPQHAPHHAPARALPFCFCFYGHSSPPLTYAPPIVPHRPIPYLLLPTRLQIMLRRHWPSPTRY